MEKEINYVGQSSIIETDKEMGYPRVCAHRGFSSVAPENSMPAFGMAIAMGAEEIEFDIWLTKDNKWVSIHDNRLDRVSNGTGKIYDYTYEELLKFDFGSKHSSEYSGMQIATFEEILSKFAGQTIFNIHVKTADLPGVDYDYLVESTASLIRKYKCAPYCYYMSSTDEFLKVAKEKAPDIARCTGEEMSKVWKIVDRAIECGCDKVQLFKPYFNQEMVDKAKANGIVCNVFFSDDEEETIKYLDMGIDTILSNDYFRTSKVVDKWKREHNK